MATIEVSGTVTRLFYENKGVEVTEFFKTRDGEIAKRLYTAWFEQPVSFGIGAEGVFKGQLSAVIEAWKNADGTPKLNREGKPGQSVKLSINGASFTQTKASAERQPMEAPAGWSQIQDDLPF